MSHFDVESRASESKPDHETSTGLAGGVIRRMFGSLLASDPGRFRIGASVEKNARAFKNITAAVG